MTKTPNFIYESTVKKQVESKETEKREEGGQTIEVTKTVKKVTPIKIAIAKPTRRIYEEAEIFYAKQIAIFIKEGLLPYSLVAKRYANDGGALSDPEKERLAKLKKDASELELTFFNFIADTNEAGIKTKNELLIKINNINSEISNIQNAYADIFENTAEMKARNKTLEWWTLILSYWDLDNAGYKPIFSDGNYEARLTAYDTIDEQNDPFVNECIRKLSYLTAFWSAARASTTAIDFASMDNLYTETLSEYKVEEEKLPEIKVEDKTVKAEVKTPDAPVEVAKEPTSEPVTPVEATK